MPLKTARCRWSVAESEYSSASGCAMANAAELMRDRGDLSGLKVSGRIREWLGA